ncbi:hypothetical protein [Mycobacterium phage WXIN]|nr:hypothetical protein [Mycobacterium phage WXIN]
MPQNRATRRRAAENSPPLGGYGCLCTYCSEPYEAASWAKPWLCPKCVIDPAVQFQPAVEVEPLGLIWVTSG